MVVIAKIAKSLVVVAFAPIWIMGQREIVKILLQIDAFQIGIF